MLCLACSLCSYMNEHIYDDQSNAKFHLLHLKNSNKLLTPQHPICISLQWSTNIIQSFQSFKLRSLEYILTTTHSFSLSLSLSEKCALENPWTLLPIVSWFIGKIFSEHASLLKWTDTGDWLLCPYLEGYWTPYHIKFKIILLLSRIWYLHIAGSPQSCMGRKWTP